MKKRTENKKTDPRKDSYGDIIFKPIIYDVVLTPAAVSVIYKRRGFLPMTDSTGTSHTKH
jgi:hypothetical protein